MPNAVSRNERDERNGPKGPKYNHAVINLEPFASLVRINTLLSI
jgi:hypothetical protein